MCIRDSISIMAASLLIALLVRRQYAPMARLAAALEKVSASRPQRMDSLLELVTNSLLRLHDENQEDRSRRLQQQRDRMLLSLLLGGFGGTEQQEILDVYKRQPVGAPFPGGRPAHRASPFLPAAPCRLPRNSLPAH